MRVRTHLIAMPWAQPDAPSIQIACLKAHLDKRLRGRSDCRTYSAFFSILHDLGGRAFQKLFINLAIYDEYAYMPLYLRRFGPAEFRTRTAITQLLKGIRVPWAKPLSLVQLDSLERSTCRFLDGKVAPNLIANGLNLVGFTLNYNQVYSSLYAAAHLQQSRADRHFLFVFGGGSASLPMVYKLITELGVPGIVVLGEGETRMQLLVRTIQGLPVSKACSALAAIAGIDPGIIVIGEHVDLGVRNPVRFTAQFENLGELALPDYDEYFQVLRSACADEHTYAAFCEATNVLVEGSRGCFSRCDFCNLNRTWPGFRKRSASHIVRDTQALTRKYHTARVQYVDNVCDAWAEEYAHLLIQSGIQQPSFMELRANHSEQYWTLLALGGVNIVQVGIEALSTPLLKAIGKGTSVVQNLAAHKYLKELDITSDSNLITHHPASTMADIEETRRILDQIPHLDSMNTAKFKLVAGSPLYERLNEQERAQLRPTRTFLLPGCADRYALESCYRVPECLSPGRDVLHAWSEFRRQYERRLARDKTRKPRLEITRVAPDTLRIIDARHGKVLSYDFSGAAARIYDVCHRGLRLGAIVQTTGLSPETIKARLAQFLRLRLVLRVDDCFLSLATRSRDELIRRFFAAQ
jgi:radical SAM superfamily enzyme YgiQ (UPF0313 family)